MKYHTILMIYVIFKVSCTVFFFSAEFGQYVVWRMNPITHGMLDSAAKKRLETSVQIH